jgi:hypothetical protein
MPDGKPAGDPCVHLTDDNLCGIFNDPQRPEVCAGFQAEPLICGENREEALHILTQLEESVKARS